MTAAPEDPKHEPLWPQAAEQTANVPVVPAAPRHRWYRRVPLAIAAAALVGGCLCGAGGIAIGVAASHGFGESSGDQYERGDHGRDGDGGRHELGRSDNDNNKDKNRDNDQDNDDRTGPASPAPSSSTLSPAPSASHS